MHDLPLITTIAIAFTGAWMLGVVTQSLKLSPIVGYLLAGVAIGPYTPGPVGDVHLAAQLAEVGVILLMFGVGLHFHLADLLAVRRVAIPGAVGQSLFATALGVVLALVCGWTISTGLVVGMALAVASTVVLIRVLSDNAQLDSPQGHVAVGWLIVEDLLTVVVLVLIPTLGTNEGGDHAAASHGFVWTLFIALLKLGALVAIILAGGSKVVPWVMVQVARLRSRELFTLTLLVMAIGIAAGSAYVFGASMALGAFLAGMVVGQSPVAQQAAADVLPLRDAFAVLFFASVGMLFDPMFLVHHPFLMLGGLGIVMIGKPLAALVIVAVIGYPARTAITVAIALAQIGEFSFILSELGRAHGLIDASQHNLIVGCAIISITCNALLFKLIPRLESLFELWPALWRFMNRNAKREGEANAAAMRALEAEEGRAVIILGYGPVGRSVDAIVRERGIEHVVIVDLNMDTIQSLTRAGRAAIFGDGYNIEVLSQAIARASLLVITLPHSANRNPLIAAAKLINPAIKVMVRTRYLSDGADLRQVGADAICFEETEVAVALSRMVLIGDGADDEAVRHATQRVREGLRAPSAG